MRKPTPLITRFLVLAKGANLDHPLGRAVALVNRHMNDGRSNANDEDSIERMRQFRKSTAKRWEQHWKSGGSVKALKYTHEQWTAIKRKDYNRVKDIINANRRADYRRSHE